MKDDCEPNQELSLNREFFEERNKSEIHRRTKSLADVLSLGSGIAFKSHCRYRAHGFRTVRFQHHFFASAPSFSQLMRLSRKLTVNWRAFNAQILRHLCAIFYYNRAKKEEVPFES